MAQAHIHKNLADKRKEIHAYIGSLERDLEQARRDLSAIVATERVFQSRGPKWHLSTGAQGPQRLNLPHFRNVDFGFTCNIFAFFVQVVIKL